MRRNLKQQISQMKASYQKELNASFEESLKNPRRWFVCGVKLKTAADQIESMPHLVEVYCLLIGLAFENVIKGILITQGNHAGKAGKLSKTFRGHKLDELVANIDVHLLSLNVEEKILLVKLEQYVFWAGRYPIPLSAKDLTEFIIPAKTPVLIGGRLCGNPKFRGGSGFINKDYDRAQQLWEKLSSHLHSLLPKE
jgi:hypothetical protein